MCARVDVVVVVAINGLAAGPGGVSVCLDSVGSGVGAGL